MKFVVAIDSLKGCLSSVEANAAVRKSLLRCHPDAEVVCIPVSDGGEGFLDALQPTGQWERITLSVCDPLMRPVVAAYLLSGHRAVIEMAQASGLQLLQEEERNPMTATTYGTGQLIADAVRRGAREIVVGLGGSATSDCGQGILQALYDAFGNLDALRDIRFIIATDVENPLVGSQGAVYTFARQKGATEEMLPLLEARSRSFAAAFTRTSRRNAWGGSPVAHLKASLKATVESAASRDSTSILYSAPGLRRISSTIALIFELNFPFDVAGA